MKVAFVYLVGLAVWVLGCILFDAVFKLHGAWLMIAGAATHIIQQYVMDELRIALSIADP